MVNEHPERLPRQITMNVTTHRIETKAMMTKPDAKMLDSHEKRGN
jgi:hypothetical protein